MTRTFLAVRLFVAALCGTAALGCGGDPLVATWVTHDYPGGQLPAGVASYEEELTFASDMSLTVSIVLQVPESASIYPGCTETCALSSLRWADGSHGDTMTLTVSGTAHKTASRSGCTSSKDDMPMQPATVDDCPPGMPGGAYVYTINNGTLTTTASGSMAKYTQVTN
jgi:hypothetical protein